MKHYVNYITLYNYHQMAHVQHVTLTLPSESPALDLSHSLSSYHAVLTTLSYVCLSLFVPYIGNSWKTRKTARQHLLVPLGPRVYNQVPLSLVPLKSIEIY